MTSSSNRTMPSGWKRLRKKVLHRDGHACVNCGSVGELHVHHIVPRSCNGANEMSNLVTVCANCHYTLHGFENRIDTSPADIEYNTSKRSKSGGKGGLPAVYELENHLPAKKYQLDFTFNRSSIETGETDATEGYIDRRLRAIDRASVIERLKWKVTGVPQERIDAVGDE